MPALENRFEDVVPRGREHPLDQGEPARAGLDPDRPGGQARIISIEGIGLWLWLGLRLVTPIAHRISPRSADQRLLRHFLACHERSVFELIQRGAQLGQLQLRGDLLGREVEDQ